MARVHTHYDNLKVARDAPMEVIHAAYRSLAAMYHPDRNGGSEEAARVMRIINTSYAALCDPIRKREHDRWIDNVAPDPVPETPPPPKESNTGQASGPIRLIHLKPATNSNFGKRWMWIVSGGVFASVILFWIFVGGMPDNPPTAPVIEQPPQSPAPPAESTPNQPAPSATSPPPEPSPQPAGVVASLRRLTRIYIRPPLAPNGESWPVASGYLAGYAQLNTNGQSDLTVDNRMRDSDALVKLFDRTATPPRAVRIIFLQAKDWLKLENIDAGSYDLRYQDLDSGSIQKCDPFSLTEDTKEASDMRITLYTTPTGTLRFETIGPNQF